MVTAHLTPTVKAILSAGRPKENSVVFFRPRYAIQVKQATLELSATALWEHRGQAVQPIGKEWR
jgi:hypothetical protein